MTSVTISNTPELSETPTVVLRGLAVHAITESECIARILHALRSRVGGWVVTPNLDILRRWERDTEFRSLVAGADLIVADGMPLVWASRLLRTPLPERIAGSNLVPNLSAAAANAGLSIYLLGGSPGAAEGAASRLVSQNPELRVAGVDCPPIGFERDATQLAAIRQRLVAADPDIIFVALGSPKQERFIQSFQTVLPTSWWLGVGVSFSFLTGEVRRAPKWMQRSGLEWLHRLAQQPRQLARRYLIDGLPYAVKLLVTSLVEGVGRRKNVDTPAGQ